MEAVSHLIDDLKIDLEHWSLCYEERGISFFVAGLVAFEMIYSNRAVRQLGDREAALASGAIEAEIKRELRKVARNT